MMNELGGGIHPRFVRDKWSSDKHRSLSKGDYVVATKYNDGDPGDQFCIGFYDIFYDHYGSIRHLVVDSNGKQFRHNGFRRVAKVGAKRGEWMVRNVAVIELLRDRYSVWHWYRASWKELRETAA